MPNKLKGRTLWDFSTSTCCKTPEKLTRDPLVEKKFEKSRTVPKKSKGGPLRGKPFWFSSLGQQVKFEIL